MKIWFFILLAALTLFPSRSEALVVVVDLAWSRDLLRYNLQDGSMVQVIAYNRTEAGGPGATADENFEPTYGEAPPYNPFTTPGGHDIVHQTEVVQTIGGGFAFSSFVLLGNYNRIYVRIFEAAEFSDTEELNYWGLGQVRNINNNQSVVSVFWNNRPAGNLDSFQIQPFEVIPEPTTVSLFMAGLLALYLIKKGPPI